MRSQTRPADEVVVVDNGSTDGTWEWLQGLADGWPELRIERDLGSLGRIRNVALALATYPAIAFTDSDCTPDPDWLERLTAPMREPSVGLVQGRTTPTTVPDRRWAATQQIESWSGLFEACNIAYRREPLLAEGGFDEQIGFFGEDTVAGLRMARAGWRCRFASAAVVRHDVTYPGTSWQLRRALGYSNWNALVAAFPELRHQRLWHQLWLNRRTAEWDFALAGVALAGVARKPWPLVAVLPYLRHHRHRRPGLAGVADSLAGVAFDAARSAGLVKGCLRHRTLVL